MHEQPQAKPRTKMDEVRSGLARAGTAILVILLVQAVAESGWLTSAKRYVMNGLDALAGPLAFAVGLTLLGLAIGFVALIVRGVLRWADRDR